MKHSIGLVELKSTPIGIKTADEMLKSADVTIPLATPICPGKFIILAGGDVAAVDSAIKAALVAGEMFVVDYTIINNVHEDVIPAFLGTLDIGEVKALGSIETISAVASVKAGDIAAKAASVKLVEIRIAKGLGGKGFLTFTGEVAAVQAAVKACLNELAESGEVTSAAVIPRPHKDLLSALSI
jgi:microcompartment protein CcmL/EutN